MQHCPHLWGPVDPFYGWSQCRHEQSTHYAKGIDLSKFPIGATQILRKIMRCHVHIAWTNHRHAIDSLTFFNQKGWLHYYRWRRKEHIKRVNDKLDIEIFSRKNSSWNYLNYYAPLIYIGIANLWRSIHLQLTVTIVTPS
jgi:hypothetical protein